MSLLLTMNLGFAWGPLGQTVQQLLTLTGVGMGIALAFAASSLVQFALPAAAVHLLAVWWVSV